MMTTRDLVTFAEFGKALWVDPERSTPAVMETLSAITLQDLTEERALERASSALLERALQQGMASITHSTLEVKGAFGRPFFRLFPSERFLLTALHLGRWSYARIARVMNATPEEIERLAWKARVRLAADSRLNPLGAGGYGAHCPEYDLERPWTQRFLDEEIHEGRERFFLQNHLMACDGCMQALNRCRDLYYAVEKTLPRVTEDEDIVRMLQAVCKRSRYFRFKSESIVFRSLIAFLAKRDVQIILVALWALVLFAILRH